MAGEEVTFDYGPSYWGKHHEPVEEGEGDSDEDVEEQE
jgi:hypothetical protein